MTEVLGQSTEALAIELAEMKLHEQEPYLTEPRREQIRRRMAYLSFELQERAKE